MNKLGLAGAGLGALALVLAAVNFSRVSGALDRLDGLKPATGNETPGGETAKTSAPAVDEDRKAEIEWLKRETARITKEIEKTRNEIANRPPVTGPGPDPDSKEPLPLTPADVGYVIERLLQKNFETQKAREAEAKIAILERNAANEVSNLGNRLQLEPAEKAKLQAITTSQLEGYAAILRKYPVPDDKQAQLDKVTADAELQIAEALGKTKAEQYKKAGGNWHGFNQKLDPKHDKTQPTPRGNR